MSVTYINPFVFISFFLSPQIQHTKSFGWYLKHNGGHGRTNLCDADGASLGWKSPHSSQESEGVTRNCNDSTAPRYSLPVPLRNDPSPQALSWMQRSCVVRPSVQRHDVSSEQCIFSNLVVIRGYNELITGDGINCYTRRHKDLATGSAIEATKTTTVQAKGNFTILRWILRSLGTGSVLSFFLRGR